MKINELHLKNDCPNSYLSLAAEFPELRKLSITKSSYDALEFEPIAALNKLTHLSLDINYEDEEIIDFLNMSQLTQSLEVLTLKVTVVDRVPFLNAITRFNNLKSLSICFYYKEFDGSLLKHLHPLAKLRSLSLGGGLCYIKGGDLIDIVQHLPDLEQFRVTHIRLEQSSFERICDIYRTRSQKLVICGGYTVNNFGKICREGRIGGNRQEFVQLTSNHGG